MAFDQVVFNSQIAKTIRNALDLQARRNHFGYTISDSDADILTTTLNTAVAQMLFDAGEGPSPVPPLVFEYAVGDSVPGTFTRASIAYQYGSNGIATSTSADVARDSHYVAAVRTLALEKDVLNLYTNSQTAGAWGGGIASCTDGQTNVDGTSTASLLEGAAGSVQYWLVADGNSRTGTCKFTAIVKRGTKPGVTAFNFDDNDAPLGSSSLDWTSAGDPVLTLSDGAVHGAVQQIGSGAWYQVSFSFPRTANNARLVVYVNDGSGFPNTNIYMGNIDLHMTDASSSMIIGDSGQTERTADAISYTVPGGAGQVGTLYEKYIDLTDGLTKETVSALTTSSTFAPELDRLWLGWKFALGTQTLARMQAA